MRRYAVYLFYFSMTLPLSGCTDGNNPTPPVAEKKPKKLSLHGDNRVDDYYWMNGYFKKNKDSSKVVAYLEAENKYRDEVLTDIKDLRDSLFQEMKARIKEKDQTVPVFHNGYYYYNRYEEGSEYPVICRRKEALDAPEIVMLDINMMSKGFEFFEAENYAVSPDNKLVAYAVDTLSRRQYTIYIKNIETGEMYPDAMYPASDDIEWANDSRHLFYVANNPQTLLAEKAMRHTVNTPAAGDKVMYREKDKSNSLSISKTTSDKFILLDSRATLSSETHFLDANHPDSDFAVLQPRIKDVLYDVAEQNGRFLIITNLDATNFRLMETPVEHPGVDNWKDVIPHNSEVLLTDVYPFKDFFVVSERKNGLVQLRIRDMKSNEDHYLDFGEPSYSAEAGENPEFDTKKFRYGYTSLTTPESEFDYNMASREKVLLKQQEVVGGYNKENYVTERLLAPAGDGNAVPVSIVYKKGFRKDGTQPLLLTGYGAYGISSDPYFSTTRLTLLDRGFAFAIAHIRGGDEMGRQWYDDGKLLKKKNTFTDFIAVAEYLAKQKFTSPDHLYAYGGSAGGLLMGAIVNMRPDLWRGVVAEVPFVDVITTMLDQTIPLTSIEFDEWGNPRNKEFYDYMKSYSPYDNVERKQYPNLLVMTGLHDSQVQYFEPSKWVARLRAMKTDNNLLVLSTNMAFGHGGASGRFDFLHDIALMCGFLLKLERA